MTNVQTVYNVDHKAGVPGLIVDNKSLDAVISKIARTAIPFGVGQMMSAGLLYWMLERTPRDDSDG